MVSDELLTDLKRIAKESASRAYCPYSGFPVGAVVRSDDGRVFQGANIENVAFGLTVCAERTALFQAVLASAKPIMVVIYTPTAAPTSPCGSCRQVLREFAPSAIVISTCEGPDVLRRSVNDLLPDAFGPDSLASSLVKVVSSNSVSREHPRICIDIDNVVTKTDEVMRQVIREVTNDRVSLEYEDIKTFNYWECQDSKGNSITREEWKLVHELFSEPIFLKSIEAIPGVQENLYRLSDHFILHFATSRLPKARKSTVEWLEENRFPNGDLHFLKPGEKHVSLGRFDVSVEDDPTQALAFASAGFGINYLLAHPWNAEIGNTENVRRVSSWDEIESALVEGLS